ncbi:hypothetical protein HMPREF9466_01771 [Fusobacterium necrophorum subsp. funduliforme 1_1_36S]|nr:hypothetical protein HMPREF9466_01771 [Fusobacterium necrophorum subsp. funduliforme 1_1_36S]
MEKRNLLDLNQQELTELLVAEGMKKFYGKEVFLWLHKKVRKKYTGNDEPIFETSGNIRGKNLYSLFEFIKTSGVQN